MEENKIISPNIENYEEENIEKNLRPDGAHANSFGAL